MAIAVLIVDLLLRASIIERKVAIQWGKSVCHAGPDPIERQEQTSGSSDIESDAESSSLRARSSLPLDSNSEAVPVTWSAHGTSRPEAWLMRNFQSVVVIFRSRGLMAAVSGIFIQSIILTSFDGVLGLFVKESFGFDSTGVGLVFLAISVPALLSTLVGTLADRYGPRRVALSGYATAALGLALLTLITHKSKPQIVGLNVLLGLTGVGLNLILTPLSAEMLLEADRLEEDHPEAFGSAGSYARVYSLLCVAYGIGTAAGPALSGFLYERTTWAATTLTLALISLLGSVPVFLYTVNRQQGAITLPEGE
ncbi:MAG: hypothetical protein LQ338_000852 [Usnochroma carphineum]|nr:MAG: hypothetical protein LQ338_000852 [Usnochroma carphineum]